MRADRQASSLAERYEKLVATRAISQQEYDDAVSRLKTAQADVAAARAAVKAARINLEYTTVRSPLAGRIGRAEVTEGAYVQKASATLLATVQQLDQVYVDLYLAVLAAQQDLYQAQQQLIEVRLARLINLADLYRALGGGWLERS